LRSINGLISRFQRIVLRVRKRKSAELNERLGYMRKWVKRIAITAVILGIVVVISGGALISYTMSKVSSMVPSKPDLDLLALQQLLREKTIVLTQEQKDSITPLLKELVYKENNQDQITVLKDKIWDVLSPDQLKTAEEWKTKMKDQAGSLLESGKAPLIEAVSNATGIPADKLQSPLDSIKTWWDGKKPTELDQLLKQLEG